MFQMLSEAYAVGVLGGSLQLAYMLAALWAIVVVLHYLVVWGYQWVNDKENEEGSRLLLFKYTPLDGCVLDYVGCTLLSLAFLPMGLGFILAAVLTVPLLFAIVIAVLCSMKLTRGVIRLKKKLNKHINDNDAHKES